MRPPRIVASALGADHARLGQAVAELEGAGVDGIQWDVMDGRFVPNLTVGPAAVAACRPYTGLPFEAHLMVEDPDPWVEPFVEAGCATVIVHAEAARHLHRTLARIRSLGAAAGVALNPATPLEAVRHVLHTADLLLVMTVNPGFGGQAYLPPMERKIAEARDLLEREQLETALEVDGGIGPATIGGARRAGADTFVVGSAITGHAGGPGEAVRRLRFALARVEAAA
ncbi:MAG TPA: ribulose-phosphate 3-epimerase [Actinomycetota bacterium]|nr:ribulose-phosphate 3-epimerase [Actinomycetota bacterium]